MLISMIALTGLVSTLESTRVIINRPDSSLVLALNRIPAPIIRRLMAQASLLGTLAAYKLKQPVAELVFEFQLSKRQSIA